MRPILASLVSVAILITAAVAIPTASAAPILRERYSGTDAWSFDDCGFAVDATSTFEGLFMLKSGHAGDATPYLFDNYAATEVFTNHETGAWVKVEHNGLYKDLRISLVGGSVYEFISIETGQPFVVSDMDGNVIVRDRGLLAARFLVDTLGDDDLSNDIFQVESWSLVRDAGRHPGFYEDFCVILSDTIG